MSTEDFVNSEIFLLQEFGRRDLKLPDEDDDLQSKAEALMKEKHLPGQHDQQSHAGNRGGAIDKTADEKNLDGYLEQVSELIGSRKPADWKYGSIEEFILKKGKNLRREPFTPDEERQILLLAKAERWKSKECFMNASKLAMNAETLGIDAHYAEGFGISGALNIALPFQHAVVTLNDKPIDFTWQSIDKKPKTAEDYLNTAKANLRDSTYRMIEIPTNHVIKTLLKRETYDSLIYDLTGDSNLLKSGVPPEWNLLSKINVQDDTEHRKVLLGEVKEFELPIDVKAFKQNIVLIPDYVSLVGSLKGDIDIVVRSSAISESDKLAIQKTLGRDVPLHFVANPTGPHDDYYPIGDLVIRMKSPELHKISKKNTDYESYCDFGGNHYSAFIKEHPEYDTEDFFEYVAGHNRADRDSGELNDIAMEEILRLVRAYDAERSGAKANPYHDELGRFATGDGIRAKSKMQTDQLFNDKIIKIDLGCGDAKPDGYIGVDRRPGDQVDVLYDIASGVLPFPDKYANEIRAHHSLEHLPDIVCIMSEIYRVLKPGGTADIVVPSTDGVGALANPNHKSYWNLETFDFFVVPELRDAEQIFFAFEYIDKEEIDRGDAVDVAVKLKKPIRSDD